MHEVRATFPTRGWLVLGAAVLLLAGLALWMLPGEGRKEGEGANVASRDATGPSSPTAETAAERARRAAIAALGPVKRNGVNAADLYTEAMGLYGGLTDPEKNMLKHPSDDVDAAAAAALYAKIQPIMALLRAARKADYLDWGTGAKSIADFSTEGMRLQREGDLAALAFWDSAYRFQTDPNGAVGDVAAMEALGRSGADSAFGLMVENGIHERGLQLIAQNLGDITSAAGPDLAEIVSRPALEQTFQNGMNGAASMVQALLDGYANPDTHNQAQTFIQGWMNSTTGGKGAAIPNDMVSELQWTKQFAQSLGTSLPQPDAQFMQWVNQRDAETASMPLARKGFQILEPMRTQVQASMTENEMLGAAMALEQNDQTRFQSFVDPASGKPFTYNPTANGFQLGSAVGRRMNFSAPAAK